jgi:membrane protein YqaA with SNARE-associated domain
MVPEENPSESPPPPSPSAEEKIPFPIEEEPSRPPLPVKEHRGWARRLYEWVLHWAETPYGTPALFLIAFAESSFFPIPPDVLQIALSVSRPLRSFFYAAVSTAGSVLGGILGWTIGYALWQGLDTFFYRFVPGVDPELIEMVSARYADYAFLTILGAAFTPIPYKVFTIAAGICDISLLMLVVASTLGRGARFTIVATMIRLFGPGIRDWIDRYFGIATLLFFLLLVGGFVVVKFLLH